jgi:hypothetical protein
VNEDATRWLLCLEAARTASLVELDERRQYVEFVCDHWANSTGVDQFAPADWEDSIEKFCRRGLPLEILTHAADIALRNTRVRPRYKWDYFMGTAWKMLTEIEQGAKRTFDYQAQRADAG